MPGKAVQAAAFFLIVGSDTWAGRQFPEGLDLGYLADTGYSRHRELMSTPS